MRTCKKDMALAVLTAICGGVLAAASAAELKPDKNWNFSGDNCEMLKEAFDGDINTAWTSSRPQKEGAGFVIDFGQAVAIHRLILDRGEGEKLFCFPHSLRCSMGMAPDKLEVFREDDFSLASGESVVNLRFNAVQGRYLRLEIGSKGAAFPWSTAEFKIYGFAEQDNLTPKDAVVLPDPMPAPNQFAAPDFGARDLSYYLGEIMGRPVPVIKAADMDKYPGLLFVLEAPRPAQAFKDNLLRNELQAVNVYKAGREIRFAGHTSTAIFYGVLEFLERHGVRWLYPSVYGDHIANRDGLRLDILPLAYTPPIERRNWVGGDSFTGRDYWFPYNRWNAVYGSVGGGGAYSGMGHHSFASLVPGNLYTAHPDWFPMMTDPKWEEYLKTKASGKYKLGDRLPFGVQPSYGTFCTSSPEAREHVVKQTVEQARKNPDYHVLVVGQMDSDFWCECPRCLKQDEQAVPQGNKSQRLADLAAYLGRRLKEELPDRTIQVATMPYSNSTLPPRTGERLPDNVSINVVISSVEDYRIFLPPASPRNQASVEALKGWSEKTKYLGVYNWDLLTSGEHGIPFAMIAGASEWFKLWRNSGVVSVQPEASAFPEYRWRYNPWAYYAYSRLAWNPDVPTEQLLTDFFNGYFREASKPMLAYYKALEDHIRASNLSYGQHQFGLKASPDIFTPAILKTMRGHLEQAEKLADNFVTRRRVADMREGFDKVLVALKVKAEDL